MDLVAALCPLAARVGASPGFPSLRLERFIQKKKALSPGRALWVSGNRCQEGLCLPAPLADPGHLWGLMLSACVTVARLPAVCAAWRLGAGMPLK